MTFPYDEIASRSSEMPPPRRGHFSIGGRGPRFHHPDGLDWVTLLPMIFMACTTFTSSILLIREYPGRAFSTLPDATTYKVNIVLIAIMFALAVLILVDSLVLRYGYFIKKKPLTSTGVTTREEVPRTR
jgi:hypothetical protein